jgi:hypothetical protein
VNFEIFMEVTMKVAVLRNMILCSVVGMLVIDQLFH